VQINSVALDNYTSTLETKMTTNIPMVTNISQCITIKVGLKNCYFYQVRNEWLVRDTVSLNGQLKRAVYPNIRVRQSIHPNTFSILIWMVYLYCRTRNLSKSQLVLQIIKYGKNMKNALQISTFPLFLHRKPLARALGRVEFTSALL